MASPRKKKRSAIRVVEIVKTCDVGPIQVPPSAGDDFRFRIEIVRTAGTRGRCGVRIWRIEHYRIQPTFPQEAGRPCEDPCDEQLLVRDDRLAEGITGSTPHAALQGALRRIEGLIVPASEPIQHRTTPLTRTGTARSRQRST